MDIYDLWGGAIGLFGMTGSVADCLQALSRSIPCRGDAVACARDVRTLPARIPPRGIIELDTAR